jgi:hypothetical protein
MVTLLATISIAATILFVAVCIAVHAARPELDPIKTSMSVYFTNGTRSTLRLGYVGLGISLISIALALTNVTVITHTISGWLAVTFFCVAALNLLPIALTARHDLTNQDARSPRAIYIHRMTSLSAFALVIIGMILFSSTLLHGFGAELTTLTLMTISALSVALYLILIFKGQHSYYGLIQKNIILLIAVWILIASTRLMLEPSMYQWNLAG